MNEREHMTMSEDAGCKAESPMANLRRNIAEQRRVLEDIERLTQIVDREGDRQAKDALCWIFHRAFRW